MKKHFLCYSLLVGMFYFAVACSPRQDATEQAQETNEEKFDDSDQMEEVSDFMVKAYNDNMLLSEASQVAAQKAQSPKVKDFAQKSLNKHNEMKQQLKTLATQMNVTLPDSLAQSERREVEDLSTAQEEDFDKKYVELVEDAHEELVKKFEDMSKKDKQNPELNNFVQQNLPALKQNKEEADQLEESA